MWYAAVVVLSVLGLLVDRGWAQDDPTGPPGLETFTYQGRLEENGAAAAGEYALRFEFWSEGGSGGILIGSAERLVTIDSDAGGLFTVADLPIGVFSAGENRWLQVLVRRDGVFEPIGDREPVRAAPFASYASSSGTGLNAAHKNDPEIDFGGNDGLFLFDTSFTPFDLLKIEPFNDEGLALEMADENGNAFFELRPSAAGAGAYMVARGPSFGGMIFDALPGDTSPSLSVVGDNAFFRVETNLTGDNSVVLPGNAVSAGEILDDPGLAHNSFRRFDGFAPRPTALQEVVVLNRSITVPASGWVLAIASFELREDNEGQVRNPQYVFDIVEDPDDDLLRYQVFDTGLEVPITIHQLFAAPTPGTYTYWLNELNFNTDSYYAMRQVRFTLLYIPSTYGLMNLDDQTTRRLSDAEERAAELARHQAAMKEELAEQRRIIEQLQHRLDASRPASRSD